MKTRPTWFPTVALALTCAVAASAQPPPPRLDIYGDALPEHAVARLGTSRIRHPNQIPAVAYSPDGSLLASASIEGRVRVWEMPSGKRRHDYSFGPDYAVQLRFSADGKRLAAAVGPHYDPKRVYVWDTASGKELLCTGPVIEGTGAGDFAFSPDGKSLATAMGKAGVGVWDVASKQVQTFGKLSGARGVGYTAGGQLLAARVDKKGVAVWDVSGAKKLYETEGSGYLLVRFSPDATMLAFVADKTVVAVHDVAKGKELHRFKATDEFVFAIEFSPDGRSLFTGGGGYEYARVWDLEAGKEKVRLNQRHASAKFAAFSPDGKTAAAGDDNGPRAVMFWDLATGKLLDPHPGHHMTGVAAVWSPDGKSVVTEVGGDRISRQWDPETGKLTRTFEVPQGGSGSMAFSRDGTLLASVGFSEGSLVRVWEAATGKPIQDLRPGKDRFPRALAWSPDGKRLAGGGLTVRGNEFVPLLGVWEPAAGETFNEFDGVAQVVRSVEFLPDGGLLAFLDNGMQFWDAAAGKAKGPVLPLEGLNRSRALSADGRFLAVAGDRGTRVWEVSTRQEIVALPPAVRGGSVGFAPSGGVVAVGRPGEARLFDWLAGEELLTLKGHDGQVVSLAFSPDGRRLVTSSDEETWAIVWDVSKTVGRAVAGGKATAEEVAGWWADLKTEPSKAYQAARKLIGVPEQALTTLTASLRPAAAVDEKQATRLIADLDSDRFEVREKATRELEQLGEVAVEPLRRALMGSPGVEQRRRIEGLMEKLLDGTAPELLRQSRAVFVLEQIARPEARKLLGELSRGAPEARLTREARSAVSRIGGSP